MSPGGELRNAVPKALTQGSRILEARDLYHALSDETRLRILCLLRQGERCVCELTEDLCCAQSRLSFHLRTLKDCGLVMDRSEGRWIYYKLNHDALRRALTFLREDLGADAGSPAATERARRADNGNCR